MRRLLCFAGLLLLLPSVSDACPLLHDLIQDLRGNVVPGATITINRAGTTTAATLYSDPACSIAATNPTTSQADGTFEVYVQSGFYDVIPAKSGYVFRSIRVQVYEPIGDNINSISDFSTVDLTAIGTGAFDVLGANTRTLIINKAALATLDDTCPSTLTLIFLGDGSLTLSDGKTLTLNCRVVNLTGRSDASVLAGTGTYVRSAAAMGTIHLPVTYAELGTADNGTTVYCSDCTVANPCADAGTGAIAKRLNGAWRCD